MQLPEQGLFIAGRRTDATSGETFETINPATGEVICQVQAAGPDDVDRAVASAREGFELWRDLSGAERGRILNRAVALLRRYNDDLARLEVADTGKPWQEAVAVDVLSGEFEAFDSDARPCPDGEGFDAGGISLEAVLASAALPTIFRAVRIGGRAYWDGLFSQNPPIKDFVAGERIRTADQKPDQIWVIQINPQGADVPTSPAAI